MAMAATLAGSTPERSRQARTVRQTEPYCRSGSSSMAPASGWRSCERSSASATSAPAAERRVARVPWVPMSTPKTWSMALLRRAGQPRRQAGQTTKPDLSPSPRAAAAKASGAASSAYRPVMTPPSASLPPAMSCRQRRYWERLWRVVPVTVICL